MYDAVEDPYCYPGTVVLINKLDLRDQLSLDAFEAEITRERSAEAFPAGDLDVTHYLAIHHHLFQDVYAWAGEIRTVRISKHGSMFCYPEHIQNELAKLFGGLREADFLRNLDRSSFAARAADFARRTQRHTRVSGRQRQDSARLPDDVGRRRRSSLGARALRRPRIPLCDGH